MQEIFHVKQGDGQAFETSERPVLVDFWAEWCGPCRAFAPTFEKLAERYGNKVVFAKANVDEVPELAGRFAIRSIPTILLLKQGRVVERWVGARPFDGVARFLEQHATTA